MSNRYKGGVISATPPTTTGGESGTASGAWTLEQQAQLQAAGLWPSPPPPLYIENVFSTYLYAGTGAAQTITNGINLSGKGGLVWLKNRSGANDHGLFDTIRGAGYRIISNLTDAENFSLNYISSFGSTGFSLGAPSSSTNASGNNYVSWTFRKQPKFFDVVTYNGTGADMAVNHNLQAQPGCVIIKRTNAASDWQVMFPGLISDGYGGTGRMSLNTTAEYTATGWTSVANSTQITIPTNTPAINEVGGTYVAYLFASNAGGFGLTESENAITCGTYTGNGSTTNGTIVNLGWEPQWILIKKSSSGTSDWLMVDNMRGMTADGTDEQLKANSSGAADSTTAVIVTSTGFQLKATGNPNTSGATYIYMAVRRGPMAVPTSGTSVFLPSTVGASNNITVGFPADTAWFRYTGSDNWRCFDRLRSGYELATNLTDAEGTYNYYPTYIDWDSNSVWYQNLQNGPVVDYFFRRAPSFFDEVCYTGTGSARTVTHNLGVVPELMIVKVRDSATNWAVYSAAVGNNYYAILNLPDAPYTSSAAWNNTTPTSSVFTVGTNVITNGNGYLYVAYLFATCAGVSKVGSYTGTGTTLQVNCGFTGGARFVLIKRTDSTGDWYVWDSARGIVSGNDPYLLLNSTAAEVTNTDYVDTYSAGFEISSTAPAAINASGGTYIFLAIA